MRLYVTTETLRRFLFVSVHLWKVVLQIRDKRVVFHSTKHFELAWRRPYLQRLLASTHIFTLTLHALRWMCCLSFYLFGDGSFLD